MYCSSCRTNVLTWSIIWNWIDYKAKLNRNDMSDFYMKQFMNLNYKTMHVNK